MQLTYLFRAALCTGLTVLCACEADRSVEPHSDVSTNDLSAPKELSGSRPNILLIVADDLGYTDLGVYGSEINTPNLDQLAKDGLILTDFHNQAVCAPTRAAILSGTDNHNAGGAMHQAPNQRAVAGYESYLNEDVVAFPALLKQSGYSTYWAGKWHLGREPHQTPDVRGFDRSFALMEGLASHYPDGLSAAPTRSATYIEDGRKRESLPTDFYSTSFYTDYIIDAIEQDRSADKPWFAFLGYTAPHWPLQAPDEAIAKYHGVYDTGYEVLREQRILNAKAHGVIPADAPTYPRLERVARWDSLSEEQQKYSAKTMEVYAAMVDLLDQNVGRLIRYLKETDQYQNTFIMFISDNGAEGANRSGEGWDNSYDNIGRPNSYVLYGPEWAGAGVGVMRYFKAYSSEGGTRGPAFIHSPEAVKKGQISHTFTSVVDIAPTALALAGVEHPNFGYNGHPLQPLQGESLLPLVFTDADSVRPDDFVFGWEVFGHLAIRKGDWKLLRLTSASSEARQRHPPPEDADNWELFNVATDPGEVNDLAEQKPELVAELLQEWQHYKTANGVVLPVSE